MINVLEESSRGTTLFVQKPSARYFDEFINLKCAPDLLKCGFFPNAKELTESMAAFNAVRTYIRPHNFEDFRNTLLIDVGSGKKPRTAALFACRTMWECISIDPALNVSKHEFQFRHMQYRAEKIEDSPIFSAKSRIIVTAVHAHVDLKEVVKHVKAPEIWIVAIPCCEPLEMDVEPDYQYADIGCWSPKNEVKIWRLLGTNER